MQPIPIRRSKQSERRILKHFPRAKSIIARASRTKSGRPTPKMPITFVLRTACVPSRLRPRWTDTTDASNELSLFLHSRMRHSSHPQLKWAGSPPALFLLVRLRPSDHFGVHGSEPLGLASSTIHRGTIGACSTSRMRWPTSQRSAAFAPLSPSKMMRLSVSSYLPNGAKALGKVRFPAFYAGGFANLSPPVLASRPKSAPQARDQPSS